MLEQNTLPGHSYDAPDPQQLFRPIFSTEQGQAIVRAARLEIAHYVAIAFYVIVPVLFLGLAVQVPRWSLLVFAMLIGVITYAVFYIRNAKREEFRVVSDRMLAESIQPFTTWVRERYGVQISVEQVWALGSIISVGLLVDARTDVVTDERTGQQFTIALAGDLVYAAPYGAEKILPELNTVH
jgi:hypothetical protein